MLLFLTKKVKKSKKEFDKGQKVRYTVPKLKRQKVKQRCINVYYVLDTTQKRGSYERISR